MSEKQEPYLHVLLVPFSFNAAEREKDSQWIPPLDFAERRARDMELFALKREREGDQAAAQRFHANAQWWRGLAKLEDSEAKSIETEYGENAVAMVDVLLARAAAGSEQAVYSLGQLAKIVHAGLHALAANGNKTAASTVVGVLSNGVVEFNNLARNKPELFRAEAREWPGIPGIITPFTEQTKNNIQLVKSLDVGKNFPLKSPTGGKKGKTPSLKTPRNYWAVLLFSYIEYARFEVARFTVMSPERRAFFTPARHPAPWLQDAVRLKSFSPDTWETWFEVAWQIVLEATEGHPEREPELFKLQSLKKEKDSKSKGKLETTPSAYSNAIKTALEIGFKYYAGKNRSTM